MKDIRILLVEDDASLGFVIRDNLEVHGYRVDLHADGEKAWHAFLGNRYDLCILDVMLPKKDGFELLDQIRSRDVQVPVLFLTARNSREDRILGFKKGGDDYITKPFSIEELIFRVEVFLKRSKVNDVNGQTALYELGSYIFSFPDLVLKRGEQELRLTQKEADVLKLFCDNPGRILKREEILKEVWKDDDYFLGRSLDVFISRLRKYLKDEPGVEIENRFGVGFRMVVK